MSTALYGGDRAFESLYRLNRPAIYAYALSRVRQHADAEDVTQTTFMKAYCALHRGVAPRDELQWLLAIARNVCRDKFRDATRRPKEEPLAEWIRLAEPEEQEFSLRDVFAEISHLNPRYRQILLMREFEGRSYAEISAEFGVSEAAVQTLLSRARRALRDELELGITCAHARRTALRQLNGIASVDERRALKRHLRRCADCAVFVGQRPRKPIAQILWLCTMPYRRLMALITGTAAAPAGPTAGVAAKLLVVTALGTTAVGVTTTEIHEQPHPSRQPTPPAPLHHHSGPTLPSAAGRSAPIPVALPHAPAASRPSQPPARASTAGDEPDVVAPQTVGDTVPAAAPDGAAPVLPTTTPATTTTPTAAESTPAAPPPSPASSDSPAAASPPPPDMTSPAPEVTTPAPATPTPSATTDAPPVAAPSPAPDPAVSPPPPAPTTTPGDTNQPGVPHGNGVGRDGTPPGQAAKAAGGRG